MSDEQENTRQDKRVPADQVEQRGIVQDVAGLVLQEAKPILEGTAAGLAVHKLTGGKNPPAAAAAA